jgi:hypothetical protein
MKERRENWNVERTREENKRSKKRRVRNKSVLLLFISCS